MQTTFMTQSEGARPRTEAYTVIDCQFPERSFYGDICYCSSLSGFNTCVSWSDNSHKC